ncbi:MAG: amino acid adenylation domain-containing protein [Planctomycetes bacterium]|nr:amino acid adenylation domain-containing protein [Planctomycetota bacterium]
MGSGFLASLERHPDRPALQVGGEVLTYRELAGRAFAIAAALGEAAVSEGPTLTAVFGQRSTTTFAGILGALFHGHGYVPLNPAFPIARTREMLERSGCRTLVVDGQAERQLPELLEGVTRELCVVLPDSEDASAHAQRWPHLRFVTQGDLKPAAECLAPPVDPGDVDPEGMAYLLFTSGSTGRPKGVMVRHRNVTAFVEAMVARYDLDETDRFSQTFDLTFDLSAFDMFVCWEVGGCLCCPTAAQKSLPARYILDCKLTVWFAVPSTAVLMNRLRMLKPDKYPSLRLSLFCGEALLEETMRAWQEAAPASICENLYGPTELTIACTLYRWDPQVSPAECERGVVPIGAAYPGMDVLIADANLVEVPPGEVGELLMTGPQLTMGYLDDPERTARAFVVPPGKQVVYYRTGDLVRRPIGSAPLVYLGRADNQIKIQGYRVELGEVEQVLRDVSGAEVAVALGWPRGGVVADSVVCFIDAGQVPVEQIRAEVVRRLPPYLQPSKIVVTEKWPLNSNGKIDRGALYEQLEDAHGAPR